MAPQLTAAFATPISRAYVERRRSAMRLAGDARQLHRRYRDVVLHPDHAGRHPCGARRLLALGPGPYCALERDFRSVGFDNDVIRIDLGVALEGLLDLLLDLGRRHVRLDPDEVAHGL